MTKRKTKRFGSPPETHRRNAARDIDDVRLSVRATRAYLKGGNCSGALSVLMGAERLIGMTYAERKGAGHVRKGFGNTGANKALASLARKFRTQCLKPRK